MVGSKLRKVDGKIDRMGCGHIGIGGWAMIGIDRQTETERGTDRGGRGRGRERDADRERGRGMRDDGVKGRERWR